VILKNILRDLRSIHRDKRIAAKFAIWQKKNKPATAGLDERHVVRG
jgi:hypothetical protein